MSRIQIEKVVEKRLILINCFIREKIANKAEYEKPDKFFDTTIVFRKFNEFRAVMYYLIWISRSPVTVREAGSLFLVSPVSECLVRQEYVARPSSCLADLMCRSPWDVTTNLPPAKPKFGVLRVCILHAFVIRLDWRAGFAHALFIG